MFDWIKSVLASSGTKPALPPELRLLLEETLDECESMYRSAARIAVAECPQLTGDAGAFARRMHDLHRGLMVKLVMEVAAADRLWHAAEREAAQVVLRHAWGAEVDDSALGNAIRNMTRHAETLQWSSLLEPFVKLPPLQSQLPEVVALAMRVANVVAKADGDIQPEEVQVLKRLRTQLESLARSVPLSVAVGATQRHGAASQPGVAKAQAVAVEQQQQASPATKPPTPPPLTAEQRQRELECGLQELDALIGLDTVKHEIRELANFVKVQAYRREHQLLTSPLSLHTVFEGNPGTGKTTVARIFGRILLGLGMLERGHTIETDRSGLVAEFAGQTGPRTHQRIDEAMHGVLFIDEAYSLVSERGDDPYGTEAIQTLLKRMEDDREQLTVVLAGYPSPMRRLLQSNPGLSSRFQRCLRFPDYTALELLKIFRSLCQKSHYRLTSAAKRKLHDTFQQLIDEKDEHFGNGRLARNAFESAIRRQATRLISIAPITRELLTTLEADDIE
ncbi:MAG: AAA family ATPase [Planctomycetales bacterium]|nr:AAA family ATPase [Planctomycetales bacterium]